MKMVQKHIVSINAPRPWPINRKAERFVMRPMPGKKMHTAMPLGMVMKDMLQLASTTRETKKLLKEGKVLVNKKKCDEVKYPVGLFDVVDVPDLGQSYRMTLNTRGKLSLIKIDAKESELKPCKILNKTSLKGKKMQLNLDDGTNLLSDNKEYKVGDTLLIGLPEMKVKDHLKLEMGALVYVKAGTKVGTIGTFEGVKSFKGGQPDNLVIKTNEGTIETRKEYALVIGHGNRSTLNLS